MTRILAVSLAAIVLAAPVWAQESQTRGIPPSSPNPEADLPGHQPNPQDRNFVERAALAGMAEVAIANTVMQRTDNPSVADFAHAMIEQHGHANDWLARIAEVDGLTLPTGLDEARKAAWNHLSGLSGAELDNTYIQHQIGDHQEAIKLFRTEAQSGQAANLKIFAVDMLPILGQHLKMAEIVKSELQQASNAANAPSGSSTPEAAAGKASPNAGTSAEPNEEPGAGTTGPNPNAGQ
jgi:putative membrane protein